MVLFWRTATPPSSTVRAPFNKYFTMEPASGVAARLLPSQRRERAGGSGPRCRPAQRAGVARGAQVAAQVRRGPRAPGPWGLSFSTRPADSEASGDAAGPQTLARARGGKGGPAGTHLVKASPKSITTAVFSPPLPRPSYSGIAASPRTADSRTKCTSAGGRGAGRWGLAGAVPGQAV